MPNRQLFEQWLAKRYPDLTVKDCPTCDGTCDEPVENDSDADYMDCSHCEGDGFSVFEAPAHICGELHSIELNGETIMALCEIFDLEDKIAILRCDNREEWADGVYERIQAEECRQRAMQRGGPLNAYDGLD